MMPLTGESVVSSIFNKIGIVSKYKDTTDLTDSATAVARYHRTLWGVGIIPRHPRVVDHVAPICHLTIFMLLLLMTEIKVQG